MDLNTQVPYVRRVHIDLKLTSRVQEQDHPQAQLFQLLYIQVVIHRGALYINSHMHTHTHTHANKIS